MTSFVNLMASDVWSDIDISRRVQALIRSSYTAEDELKAARLARQAVKSDADTAFIAAVDSAITVALAEGAAARADMAILAPALEVEQAMRRISMPVIVAEHDANGAVTNQDFIDNDTAARTDAQAVIDAATDPVKALVATRNPAPVDLAPGP